jgi:hypothetical protein
MARANQLKRLPTLFISHAANDKPVVDLIVDLLKRGVGVPSECIYCTALEQGGNKGGEQFIQGVFKRLNEPGVVVLALMSRNFNDSPFCGNEVGAVWINTGDPLLYVIPPSDHKVLRGVLVDRHAPSLAKRTSLEELRERLTRLLSLKPARSDDWNVAVRRFLHQVGPAAFEIERNRAGIKHDVFLSTPMSTVSDNDYVRIRGMALKLLETLEKANFNMDPRFSAYYAARTYASKKDFDKKAKAVEQDFAALRASQRYILLIDRDVPKTSAYFEAGMALAYAECVDSALQRRSTYFVRSDVALPFMMEEVDRKRSEVEILKYDNEDDLLSIVTRYQTTFASTRWKSWGIEE